MVPGLGKIAEVEKAARRIEKLAPVAKAIKAVDHVATAVKETRIAGYVDEIATTVGDVGRLLDIVPSNITAAPMPSMRSADRLQPELMALDKVKVDVSVSLDQVRMDVAQVATGAGMRERVLANIESSRAVREARSQSGSAAYSKRERVLQNVVEQRRIRSARAEGGWSGYKAREADVSRNSSVNVQKTLPRVRFTSKTIEAMGAPPPKMKNPHRHHILEVNGRPGEHRATIREGQDILRSYDIDPLQGLENLVWAPNKGHTLDAAERLVQELRSAKEFGFNREAVIDILSRHGDIAARR